MISDLSWHIFSLHLYFVGEEDGWLSICLQVEYFIIMSWFKCIFFKLIIENGEFENLSQGMS